MSDQPRQEVLRHTARVVSAHLGYNPIETSALPKLIQAIYGALAGLSAEPEAAPAAPRTPAVPIRKSVFPDHIVCLEDGAKLKTLRRYLQSRFGLTPTAYRERWGLPSDYPMVAPEYTNRRSILAKQSGLGRKAVPSQPGTEADGEITVTKVPARRARGSKG